VLQGGFFASEGILQGKARRALARLGKLGEAKIVRLSEGCEARLRKIGKAKGERAKGRKGNGREER